MLPPCYTQGRWRKTEELTQGLSTKRLRRVAGQSFTLFLLKISRVFLALCIFYYCDPHAALSLDCFLAVSFYPDSELAEGKKQISLFIEFSPPSGSLHSPSQPMPGVPPVDLQSLLCFPHCSLAPLPLPLRLAHSGLPLSDHWSVSPLAKEPSEGRL